MWMGNMGKRKMFAFVGYILNCFDNLVYPLHSAFNIVIWRLKLESKQTETSLKVNLQCLKFIYFLRNSYAHLIIVPLNRSCFPTLVINNTFVIAYSEAKLEAANVLGTNKICYTYDWDNFCDEQCWQCWKSKQIF